MGYSTSVGRMELELSREMQCVFVYIYMLSAYMLVLKSQKWMRSSRKAACRKGQRVQRAEQRRILRCRGSWKKKNILGTKGVDRKKEKPGKEIFKEAASGSTDKLLQSNEEKNDFKSKILKILALKEIYICSLWKLWMM